MEINEWWPRLDAGTKEWLMSHSGEPVPAAIVGEILAVGGAGLTAGWWVGEQDPDGLLLSDQAVDWVEAVANGETPTPPPVGP